MAYQVFRQWPDPVLYGGTDWDPVDVLHLTLEGAMVFAKQLDIVPWEIREGDAVIDSGGG